ncbi:hypothetical protein MTR_4g036440 [Medicago truncatula]|uniref:Uncharacterized protein n=1 Tax=Medicago truncatula TaxID=3880 RepID=G7JSE5_MEDTR|nr:hypothetical protein MTR_4g036440 [Medicago truncatula]
MPMVTLYSFTLMTVLHVRNILPLKRKYNKFMHCNNFPRTMNSTMKIAGLREAINNGDIAAVKKLLNEATVFNQTDIVFILVDSGENLEYKNAQGETPLDCAPATLIAIQNENEDARKWSSGPKDLSSLILLFVVFLCGAPKNRCKKISVEAGGKGSLP